MTLIQAVPKTYAGVRFRSTLEADWAYNLDLLDIVWQYEPEAVQLPSGTYYRPDFYLPELTTWLEVKGPHDERIEKTEELTASVVHSPDCEGLPPGGVSVLGVPLNVPDSTDYFAWVSHHQKMGCGFYMGRAWRMVVVARPSISGRMTWEGPNRGATLYLCSSCGRYGFRSVRPWCRHCGDESYDRWYSDDKYYSGDVRPDSLGAVEVVHLPFKQLSWK